LDRPPGSDGGKSGLAPLETIGPYRILNRLGGGGMGVIYRAIHVDTGRQAAVKTVRFPHPANLSSLRVEIHALGRLKSPGVVQILDQGIWDGLPWYAMELLEGTTLRDWLDRVWPDRKEQPGVRSLTPQTAVEMPPFPAAAPEGAPPEPASMATATAMAGRPRAPAANDRLNEALHLFARLCGPLAFIHGEGVVHRDLKPANVFIRDDGSPVLVDFGLASSFRGAVGRETLEIGGELMGTAAYMAPEQVRAELVDARTDLYALGCMLYEALTGQVPFAARDPQETASKHLYQQPMLPSELAKGIPAPLERLVLTLIEKNPSDRIGHADDVAEILFDLADGGAAARGAARAADDHPGGTAYAADAPDGAPRVPRAAGYLYRPELVGRDDALATLEEAIGDAIRSAGALVLVVGESGVGKTFLAAEAGRRARMRGLRVIAGDALAIAPAVAGAAGGALTGPPFQLFRQLLQTVADLCRESGDDALFDRLLKDRAAILAPYEPTLAILRGHGRHPPLAAIPGEATRRRAIQALMEVLAACARERPLCLILDDLQWADDLSMALLASLPPGWLADQAIVLIATCRSEEMNDDVRALAARPDVRPLRLPMLSEGAVTSLVAGMLGMKAAPAALVSFLARQTEGNPFFVAEYLRAAVGENLLFRRRGQWRVAPADGGESPGFEVLALPGSLQQLVERRLRKLSAGARDLVKAAAVLGGQLDSRVLEAVAQLDERDLLDARGELYAREILEDLGGGRLRFIHDKMREVTYLGIAPDERRRRHHAAGEALEDQFRGTPDMQLLYAELAHHFTSAGDTRKAIDYLEKAGQQALANSANRESIQRFRTALALDTQAAAPAATAAAPIGAIRRATWERQIGEAEFALTSLDDSQADLLRALDHLGLSFPRSTPRLFLGVIAQIAQQAAHRLWPSRYVGTAGPRAATLAEGARTYETLLQIFYMASRPGPILYGAVRLLNLCERAGPSPALARAYAGIFGTAGVMGLHPLARSYLTRATQMLEMTTPDPTSESWVYQLATFYWTGVGAWAKADDAGRRAADAALAVGNRRRWEESQLGVGLAQLLGGRLRAARTTFEGLRDSGMKGNHNAEQHAWILLAQVDTRLGDLARAREGLRRAAAIVPSKLDATVLAELHATQALTSLALGEHAAARIAADRAAAALWSLPPVMNMLIPHLASLCEVYLSLWARAEAGGDRGAPGDPADLKSLRQAARSACGALHRFVRVFPIVAPIAGVHEGRLAWLSGHEKAATRRWQRALVAARRLSMPYEEALAALALGEHGVAEASGRRRHAVQARDLFAELGATPDRERAQSIVDTPETEIAE
jgi:serine/threonine protein kinase/tetratricopeptide (TPR) repeat protein